MPTEIHSDKRFGRDNQEEEEQMPLVVRQEDVMNLLLRELQTLDIEALNGAALKAGDARQRSNQQQQLQQLQQGAATGADLASAVLAAGNRLRGRSAFLMGGGGGGGGNHQVAPSFQPSSLGLNERGGGVIVGYPKRTANSNNNNNRHVPCFFNAITCFWDRW